MTTCEVRELNDAVALGGMCIADAVSICERIANSTSSPGDRRVMLRLAGSLGNAAGLLQAVLGDFGRWAGQGVAEVGGSSCGRGGLITADGPVRSNSTGASRRA